MRRASALAQVVGRIRAQGADVVLIGAAAMAGHGAARSTGDVDLLCVDRRVLRSSAWPPSEELSADVRFGDVDDPLDGVVRARVGRGRPVDVIFLFRPWAEGILARAAARPRVSLQGVPLAVPDVADLILLKLYAGGPRDLADIRALLAAADATAVEEVEGRLADLPQGARDAWLLLRPPHPP